MNNKHTIPQWHECTVRRVQSENVLLEYNEKIFEVPAMLIPFPIKKGGRVFLLTATAENKAEYQESLAKKILNALFDNDGPSEKKTS